MIKNMFIFELIIMYIGFNNPRIMYYMKVVVSDQAHALEKTDLERDLGVHISSDLKSRGQVNQAVSKANSMLCALKRTFTCRGVEMWKRLYTAYMRPNHEFAVSAWLFGSRGCLSSTTRAATVCHPRMAGFTGPKNWQLTFSK